MSEIHTRGVKLHGDFKNGLRFPLTSVVQNILAFKVINRTESDRKWQKMDRTEKH